MKTNVLLLTTILSLVLTAGAMAQQKPMDFSIKVYGGYGILAPNSDYLLETQGVITNGEASGFYYKNLQEKLGQAPHFGIGGGLALNDVFTVGLDLDYLTGSSKPTFSFPSGSGNNVTGNVASSFHLFSVIPNITYKIYTQPQVKYSIYNTLGIVAGVSTKLSVNINANDGDDQVYKFGANFGLKDAVGAKFALANNIQGFAEVSGFFLSAAPTKRIITEEGNIVVTQTQKNSGTINDVRTANSESYNEDPENPYHFSSFGINVGVIFSLPKMK